MLPELKQGTSFEKVLQKMKAQECKTFEMIKHGAPWKSESFWMEGTSTIFNKATSITEPGQSPRISFFSKCLCVCVPCWRPSCEISLLIHALNSCPWPMCYKTALCSHKATWPCTNRDLKSLVAVQNSHHACSWTYCLVPQAHPST